MMSFNMCMYYSNYSSHPLWLFFESGIYYASVGGALEAYSSLFACLFVCVCVCVCVILSVNSILCCSLKTKH